MQFEFGLKLLGEGKASKALKKPIAHLNRPINWRCCLCVLAVRDGGFKFIANTTPLWNNEGKRAYDLLTG
jgi:hypothetical protein